MAGPVVVKFGGSLLGSPNLAALLAVAARRGAVVAPGGGRFADAVRDAQADLGFSDAAAHRMAILAMDQTAELLGDAAPDLPVAGALPRLLRGGAIWRPSPLALEADLPRSWDVTSDSLALWLAIEIGAARVVILKSAAVDRGAGLDALSQAGVVDGHLPRIAGRFHGETVVLGPATPTALDEALCDCERRAA